MLRDVFKSLMVVVLSISVSLPSSVFCLYRGEPALNFFVAFLECVLYSRLLIRSAMNSLGFLIYLDSSEIGFTTLDYRQRAKMHEKMQKKMATKPARPLMKIRRPLDISRSNYSSMIYPSAADWPTTTYIA